MSIERLKFRGKVKAKKSVEMNGYTLVPNTWLTTDMISGGDHLDNVPEKIHEFWHLVDDGWIDPATVGQWTGLVDKNGVEIYEGDVIESIYNVNDTAIVTYEDGEFTGYREKLHNLSIARGWSNTVVVVGNIHEVQNG